MSLSSWRASRRELTFELALPPAEAQSLCLGVLRQLGWIQDEAGSSIRASEDPASLCCTAWPVEVEVILTGEDARSTVELVATTPGRGPIQQRQLRDRMSRLAWEIRDRAEALSSR